MSDKEDMEFFRKHSPIDDNAPPLTEEQNKKLLEYLKSHSLYRDVVFLPEVWHKGDLLELFEWPLKNQFKVEGEVMVEDVSRKQNL